MRWLICFQAGKYPEILEKRNTNTRVENRINFVTVLGVTFFVTEVFTIDISDLEPSWDGLLPQKQPPEI